MFDCPDYYNSMSLRLSQVLDDIEVNKEMVLKRRRATLQQETTGSITHSVVRQSIYMFGSLSEGTTTVGLNSDMDTLRCVDSYKVIQDYAEWERGCINLMMIQDDTTSPGYCHLQLIRPDQPLPATYVPNEHFVKVSRDRVLLKNTYTKYLFGKGSIHVQHGPSWPTQGKPGSRDCDYVPAFYCKSWPNAAGEWLHRQGLGRWPSAEMKRFAENSGCFVVAVGSKTSQNPVLEWRISTSLAERCLMFSLNITQIRCYVLMKMILKTYLNNQGEGHLSSFMCKTVLLYCIENTHSNLWVETNLLTCISHCLQVIFTCLLQGNCPHFIIPGNNLMAGQFSVGIRCQLLENLCYILQSRGQAFFRIQTDDLGHRLQIKLNMIQQTAQSIPPPTYIYFFISGGLLRDTARCYMSCYQHFLKSLTFDRSETTQQQLLQSLHRYTRIYREGDMLEQTACSFFVPMTCSLLGTVIASSNIQTTNTVSPEALNWLHLGCKSDVLSGKLKLASVLYSVGNLEGAEVIFNDSVGQYCHQAVEPICNCYDFHSIIMRTEFCKADMQTMRKHTTFCVIFTPAEIHCAPRELQYEMFRSTKDDMLHRDEDKDCWMDRAVVDSLPYLHFLQYKIYGQLQRYASQQQALNNLLTAIMSEPGHGHRETALNLLGQCMEQENQMDNALHCYMRSLNIRQRNNVAGIHICKLFTSILNPGLQ